MEISERETNVEIANHVIAEIFSRLLTIGIAEACLKQASVEELMAGASTNVVICCEQIATFGDDEGNREFGSLENLWRSIKDLMLYRLEHVKYLEAGDAILLTLTDAHQYIQSFEDREIIDGIIRTYIYEISQIISSIGGDGIELLEEALGYLRGLQ